MPTFDGKADQPNIKPLLYNTAEAAFLAGYAAADYTKTGKVGTYGGMPFPTVTIFMDGFKQGAEYYAEENGKDVEVVGWDGKNGSFTGGFEANEAATSTAKQILDQDVDVILPVGGPIYQGAITAIEDAGKDIAMVGVDADLYETDPTTQDYVMTSILKGMKVSTYEAIMAAGNDEFDFAPYVGTLENDGVGIAPFHNFEDKVNPDLAARARRGQGRHHRRLDQGELLPGLITRTLHPGGRPTNPSASLLLAAPPGPGLPTISTPRMRCHETRPARHHQTLRQRGGQRLDLPHGGAR